MEELLLNREEPANSAPIIEFRGVSKTYPTGTHALEDVNITINNGEFVFVVGSSGAGKSTFMKLIMREEKANTGIITVNGFNLTKMPRKQVPMLRRTMGIVFQDFRLIPTMNVFQNVAFAMHVVGASGRDVRREVSKALSKVGLGNKARSMPAQLSGGEQQRVSIARALAKNPKLLLCDEPTGALDYKTGKQILQLLQDTCRKQGITVIIITHNSALAPMADRLIRFKSGRVESETIQQNPVPIETIEW